MKIEKKKYPWFFVLQVGLKKTYSKTYPWALTIFIALNVLFLYYFLLAQKTTWDAFWQSNTAFYAWSQVILSIINALLIGVSISMLFSVIEEKRKTSKMSLLQTFSSLLFSAAATGCSVCSAFLLPLLGIAASLTALPLGGLEIKILSILMLLYVIYEYAKVNSGLCTIYDEPIITTKDGQLHININKKTAPKLKSLALLIVFILVIYMLPRLPSTWRIRMQKDTAAVTNSSGASKQAVDIFSQINPPQGYEIAARYGDIGPKMIEMGVIDFNKFKDTYEKSGQPLSQEQLAILTKGSDQKMRITSENSYFLLNFFWAFGLANQTKILTEGDMVKYGQGQTGNFASTGGWTLAKGDPMQYYSKRALAPLTAEQEKLVNDVASNVYRPCCGNSTAFPDCNHGMALLGIFELMASQGASENQMYEAAKYINSYWFPGNAYDAAVYFKNKDGLDFKNINPRIFLSKDIFSAFGAQAVKKWLVEKNLAQPPPKQGGGCGA